MNVLTKTAVDRSIESVRKDVVSSFDSKLRLVTCKLEEKIQKLENKLSLFGEQRDTLATSGHRRLADLSDEVAELKTSICSISQQMAESRMSNVQQQIIDEISDRERRACNIIVVGLATEEANHHSQQRRVKEMLVSIGVANSGDLQMIRLRPNLLLVKLESKQTRDLVLKMSRKLRTSSSYKSVYVNPDLTPTQRQENRKRREQQRHDLQTVRSTTQLERQRQATEL